MNAKLASLLTGFAASVALSGAAGEEVAQSQVSFLSGGRQVGMEVFEPRSASVLPAIVVLHGAGGVAYGNAYVRDLASAFAHYGFATYLVHYFDSTGDSWVSDDAIRSKFDTWLSVISDAVTFVANQPRVDKARIATFGFSLGAYLAVANAVIDPRIRAVVELAGGIDPSHAKNASRMPPMLILHGQDDRRVLVDRAHELEQLLQKLKVPYQVQLYRGEGHMLSPLSAVDAFMRGITFLQHYLNAAVEAPRSSGLGASAEPSGAESVRSN